MRNGAECGLQGLSVRLNEPSGRISCRPSWQRTRANSLSLTDWELWLVWRGRGWMRTRTRELPLFPGFCALMRPGGIYDAGQDSADPLGVTFIHFDLLRPVPATASDEGRGRVARGSGATERAATPLPAAVLAPAPATETVWPQWPEFFLLDDVEYVDLLTRRIIAQMMGNLQASEALLYAFLCDLLRRPVFEEGDAPAGNASAGRPSVRDVPHYRELQQLIAKVRTASPEALPGVAQMAASLSLSPEHFSRLFRRVSGQSPMRFILDLRLTHARHLLRESSLSVSEIADLLGYADVYFFSRQFKDRVGVSPLAYRRGDGGDSDGD